MSGKIVKITKEKPDKIFNLKRMFQTIEEKAELKKQQQYNENVKHRNLKRSEYNAYMRLYQKKYFQEKGKYKTHHCDICNIDVKNLVIHKRTKKHQKNIFII